MILGVAVLCYAIDAVVRAVGLTATRAQRGRLRAGLALLLAQTSAAPETGFYALSRGRIADAHSTPIRSDLARFATLAVIGVYPAFPQ
jgi:hypothetical protein